ncbi:hypothetical protein [Silvimonas soli]|uniref:hypothetical protein n=1 Tax=Silvimonas soli TaxID=2980100 RepID=UPI0024B35F6C|nr:hypothetical protein [Silvimonas soli]
MRGGVSFNGGDDLPVVVEADWALNCNLILPPETDHVTLTDHATLLIAFLLTGCAHYTNVPHDIAAPSPQQSIVLLNYKPCRVRIHAHRLPAKTNEQWLALE